MKNYNLILIFIFINGCIIDKALLEDYKVINSTQLDLEFKTFENNKVVNHLIKKNSEIKLDQFHGSDQFYPYDLYDSIVIKFSDNKILKYNKSDNCNSDKSFFCSTNTSCINKICTFEIDSLEYKKAK